MNLNLEVFIGTLIPSLTQDIRLILSYDTEIEIGHREKTGAYYTPVPMAIEMVLDSVSLFLKQNSNIEKDSIIESFFNFQMSLDLAQQWLDRISRANWLDMASGTGVFAFCHLKVLQILAQAYGIDATPILQVASGNMMVSDVNPQAMAKLKELMSLSFGNQLPLKVAIGNTLTEFHLQPSFQEVMDSGGFDIIIGNPPYLGERGNKAVFQTLRQSSYLAPYYEGKMDLFYFFLRLGIKWLGPRGVLTQITTHYFTTADGAKNLRKQIQEETDVLVLQPLNTSALFKDVKSLCFLSFTLCRREVLESHWEFASANNGSGDDDGEIRLMEVTQPVVRPTIRLRRDGVEEMIPQEALYDSYGHMRLTDNSDWALILNEFEAGCSETLQQILEINQGVVSGADRLRESHRELLKEATIDIAEDEKIQGPIFVFEPSELPQDAPKEIFKPFVKNSHIKPFQVTKEGFKWLLYTDSSCFLDFPQWLDHLERFRPVLSLRREVERGLKAWYQLQWGRNQAIFERPKILVPQRAKKNQFAFWEGPLYGSADVYFLGSDILGVSDLKAYTAYLNSAFVYLWLFHYGKRKGDLLELYASPLGKIPVPQFTAKDMNCLNHWYQACYEFHNSPKEQNQNNAIYLTLEEMPVVENPEWGLHCYLCEFFGFDQGARDRLWAFHHQEN